MNATEEYLMEYITVVRSGPRWSVATVEPDLDEARCFMIWTRNMEGRNVRLIEAPASATPNLLRDLEETGSLFQALRNNPGAMELRS